MKDMGYVTHIQELRKRIIVSFVFFIIAVAVGLLVATYVIQWLKPDHLEWNTFALSDALTVYIKMSTLIGFVISFPFFLYQIWAFVRPGLKKKEQSIAFRFIPIATILFLIGLSFGYFILFPMIIQFMVNITEASGATLLLGITQYFSFLFGVIIPISILFELPIIVMFLTRLRLITPARLHKFRKFAYLLLVILATVITPAEIITDILVSIPLFILYEISVLISKVVFKKQKREEEAFLIMDK